MRINAPFAAFAAATALAAAAAFADGHVTQHGDLSVVSPFARASAGSARAGAAFMEIRNAGEADRLIAAEADVSARVELHTHILDGDVVRMRQVEAIDVAAGETTMLEPGGLHVMFMGLNGPLEEGSAFPLTLVFEKAGPVEITVPVKGVAAMGAHGHGMRGN